MKNIVVQIKMTKEEFIKEAKAEGFSDKDIQEQLDVSYEISDYIVLLTSLRLEKAIKEETHLYVN